MNEFNKAISDGELMQNEVNEILQNKGISSSMMDKELARKKKS